MMLNNASQAYDRFCRTRYTPASEEQIVDLERKIGVGLPDEYRQYLLLYNGGMFTEPLITLSDPNCPQDCLRSMYGIGAPKHGNLASKLDLFDDNYPAIFLPIGYTLMGNLLLLVTEDAEDKGQVLLKRAFEDLGAGRLRVLAESIDAFFGLLREDPEAWKPPADAS